MVLPDRLNLAFLLILINSLVAVLCMHKPGQTVAREYRLISKFDVLMYSLVLGKLLFEDYFKE